MRRAVTNNHRVGSAFGDSPKAGSLGKDVFREFAIGEPIRDISTVRCPSLEAPGGGGGPPRSGSSLVRSQLSARRFAGGSLRAFAFGSLLITSIADICDGRQISRGHQSPGTPKER